MSALVRLTHPVNTLSNLFDDFFGDSAFARQDRDLTNANWPRVDITEEDKEYRIHADLPGMSREEIKVTVENGVLTISGEKKTERQEEKKDRYRHLERTYGRFTRSFYLPDNVDPATIVAHHKNGVLELTIKKDEKAAPRAIEVRVD